MMEDSGVTGLASGGVDEIVIRMAIRRFLIHVLPRGLAFGNYGQFNTQGGYGDCSQTATHSISGIDYFERAVAFPPDHAW